MPYRISISPVIRYVGTLYRFSPSECDDLVQNVMLKFFDAEKKFVWDERRARFRTWFGRIVRTKIADHYRRRREIPSAETEAVPVDPQAESLFLDEWRKLVLQEAEQILRERVSPETFLAYELYAVQRRPAEKVAAFLGCSVNQVYQARKRCFAMMREILRGMNEADPDLQMELSRYDS